jgi:eukaryotic-like serine/threonine-protein kinase
VEPNTPNRDQTRAPNSFNETRGPEGSSLDPLPPEEGRVPPATRPDSPAAPSIPGSAGPTVPGTVEVVNASGPTLTGNFSEVTAVSANGTEASSTAGPIIAGYELLGELGKGGMGVVYKARQLSLKRLVALKMILATRSGPEVLARFRAEAETVARLAHPNIVQIYEVGEHNGLPFLSLEFVDGGNLEKTLRATSLAPSQASELVRTLARASHAAHEKGVIHRDLKPANVLLQTNATTAETDNTDRKRKLISSSVLSVAGFVPKITDFGLAKDLEETGQTREGSILGTPSYMAPEQAEGRIKDIGPWTDVYALGAILYECLTGRPPFKGQTAWDTLSLVREQEPVAPHHLQPGCPRDLETICLKCLRKEITARYQSAVALADDLDRFLTGQPITARRVGVVTRAVKWARRHPASAALAVVLVLAAVGLAVAVPWHVARLETAVDEAKADVLRLRDREQRAGVRADGQRLLREGQEALARGSVRDLQDARALFAGARDRITASDAGQDPALKELRDDAGHRPAVDHTSVADGGRQLTSFSITLPSRNRCIGRPEVVIGSA